MDTRKFCKNQPGLRNVAFALALLLPAVDAVSEGDATNMVALVDTTPGTSRQRSLSFDHLGPRNSENTMSMTQRLMQNANRSRLTGAYHDAETAYRRLIALYGSDSTNETALIDVYHQLGATYYSLAEYEQSIEALGYALSLIRRVEGVNSVRQLAVLDWLTVSYVQNGQMAQADGQQLLAYHLVLANTGDDDANLLPALMKLADWYLNRGKLDDALFVFEDALALVDNSGMTELEKLGPMRGIATILDRQSGLGGVTTSLARQSIQFSLNQNRYAENDPGYRQQIADWYRTTGQLTAAIDAYEEALSLTTEAGGDPLELLYGMSSAQFLSGQCCAAAPLEQALQNTAISINDRAQALLHVADLHLVQADEHQASQYYAQAWQAMARTQSVATFDSPELLGMAKLDDVSRAYQESPGGGLWGALNGDLSVDAQASIGAPLGLCRSKALQLARTESDAGLVDYVVNVSFSVTRHGGVENVSVEQSNAPRKLQKYVVNTLQQSHFRPAMVEGQVVDTHNVKLSQRFDHRVSDRDNNRVVHDSNKMVSMGCEMLAMDI
jgi:TonB family protein